MGRGNADLMATNDQDTRTAERGGRRRRQPLMNRVVLAVLRSPVGGVLGNTMVGLRYPAADGHQVLLPVEYVADGHQLIVLVGASSTKRWWRHFLSNRPVDVWWRGAWRSTTAQAHRAGNREHDVASAAYRRGRPRVKASTDPVVLIAIPADGGDVPATGADA